MVATPSAPAFAHDRPSRIGVLLVNLGTPDAPTAPAVRRYLAEFLSDPRVVEIPPAVWQPILHGVVLRLRPAKSAKKYAAIWGNDGSPLLVHSVKQRSLVMGLLGERLKAMGLPSDFAQVELAMRYGEPAIPAAMERLAEAGCDRVLVVPLYPQYAASTTASAMDAVGAHLRRMRRVPAIRSIDCFHDDPAYIAALAHGIGAHWHKHGQPDRLVLSFHGLPRRVLELGDPYHCHCQKTARLLARELGLDPTRYVLAFQSRFGRAQWLEPYTAEVLASLAREGAGRVDVACPGFVADCLETLEEIGIEGRRTFLAAGGREFHLIPCLDEDPQWIAALTGIILRNLQGWLIPPPDSEARAATQARAVAMGAPA